MIVYCVHMHCCILCFFVFFGVFQSLLLLILFYFYFILFLSIFVLEHSARVMCFWSKFIILFFYYSFEHIFSQRQKVRRLNLLLCIFIWSSCDRVFAWQSKHVGGDDDDHHHHVDDDDDDEIQIYSKTMGMIFDANRIDSAYPSVYGVLYIELQRW